MQTQQIFNIGTTVYYNGDTANRQGYGKITDQMENYVGEIEFEITLEDGRKVYNVFLADFESNTVLGNVGAPEFYLADGDLVEELNDFEEVEDDGAYEDIKRYHASY
jgi:hypothetical protein